MISAPADGAAVAPGQVELRGTAQPGSTVTVVEGASVLGAATAGADGAWSITVTAPAGAHAYEVTAADACAAGAAASVAITAGTPAGGDPPVTPGGTAVTPLTPAGPDDRIEVLPQVVSGCTAKPFTLYLPGAGVKRVSFRVDGREVLLATRRDGRGRFAWRIDPRAFRAGTHRTTARITPVRGKARTVPMRSFGACVVGRCISRRAFKIRVRKVRGDRVVTAKVYVNKKRVRVVRGKRLRAAVVLTGLPAGRFNVRVVSTLASGLSSVDERTYQTCKKKKKKRP